MKKNPGEEFGEAVLGLMMWVALFVGLWLLVGIARWVWSLV